MATITLRVLDGADRGRAFEEVPTPVTIGREEGNSVQLNDERVSRFHLKIQEDDGKVVLTDLESTNGTKVNGEPTQLWLLRPGDVISVGRTVLLFGSRDEIAARLAALRGSELAEGVQLSTDDLDQGAESVSLEFELNWANNPDAQALLHRLAPPELPDNLGPGQAAQLAEMLQYLHLKMRRLIQGVRIKGKNERVTLDPRHWQGLLDLQDRLAQYLRAIGEPDE